MLRNYFLITYTALTCLTACNCDRQPNEEKSGIATPQISIKTVKLQKLEILTDQPGSGKEAKNGDTVLVHYEGKLLSDGSVFDSSYSRGKEFSFVLGQGRVIKGWEQGVLGMKEGEIRILKIPSDLAYGSRGAGGVIPPDADLEFKVELIEVNPD